MVAVGFLQAICKTSAKSNGFADGKNLGFFGFDVFQLAKYSLKHQEFTSWKRTSTER